MPRVRRARCRAAAVFILERRQQQPQHRPVDGEPELRPARRLHLRRLTTRRSPRSLSPSSDTGNGSTSLARPTSRARAVRRRRVRHRVVCRRPVSSSAGPESLRWVRYTSGLRRLSWTTAKEAVRRDGATWRLGRERGPVGNAACGPDILPRVWGARGLPRSSARRPGPARAAQAACSTERARRPCSACRTGPGRARADDQVPSVSSANSAVEQDTIVPRRCSDRTGPGWE